MNRGSFAAQANSTYDPNLGYLAFGGIAPVATTKTAVTVPVQGYAASSGATEYFFYTVDIDAYTFNGSSKLTGSGKQAILDTGTTLNYVPTSVAKKYNAKFVPPAKFVKDEDTYYVDCNATVPAFSVTIGGTEFAIDGKDQILPAGTDDDGNVVCISGTQDGGSSSDADNIFIMLVLSSYVLLDYMLNNNLDIGVTSSCTTSLYVPFLITSLSVLTHLITLISRHSTSKQTKSLSRSARVIDPIVYKILDSLLEERRHCFFHIRRVHFKLYAYYYK